MTAPEPRAWLDALAETHSKATEGPWRWDAEFGEKDDTGLALTNDAGAEIVGAYNTHCCSFRDDPTVSDEDRDAIVAAHNAMPELLRLARERHALEAAVLALAEELDRETRNYAEEAEGFPRVDPKRSALLGRALGKKAAARRLRSTVTAAPAGPHTTDEEADRG